MENAIGSAAATALGFITGNSRGAKLAYNAFQTYHNTNKKRKLMANGRSTSRGRSKQPTPPSSRKRRRSNTMSRSSSRSLVSSMRSNPFVSNRKVTAISGSDAKQSGHVISGKRVTKLRKTQKKVKITRQFKKKVDAALSKISPNGYYQERFYNKFKPVDFRQTVADLGGGTWNGEFGTSSGTLFYFDPVRVLDAASVLFNAKTPIANKGLNDINNFDAENFSCEVVRQWVEINLKNNSARNIEVKLWTWELKAPSLTSNFGVEWGNIYINEAGVVGPPVQDGKINVLSIGADTLGANPQLSPAMRNRFNIEEKIILLEPGKYFKHTVQGPRKLYEFPKFATSVAGFLNAQKGVKGVCMAISVDNTSATTWGAGYSGRITDITSTDGFGILTETIYNYVIKVPDQAGFTYGPAFAAGTMQTLKQKRHGPYAVKVWNDPGAAVVGSVAEVPDENPQNQGAVGV